MANDYLSVSKLDDCISVAFYIEDDTVMEIGEKLRGIDESAYMNGYNREALLNCYVENNASQLAETYETDSEAEMFAAYFENSPEGEKNSKAMAELIISLIENEEQLFEFVRSHGIDIEWD